MLNSTVLEVAIGLVFCYASVALIASSIFEALSSWLNLRAKMLYASVSVLLNAHEGHADSLVIRLYNNALVHPAGNGRAISFKKDKTLPAYIPAKQFSRALVQALQPASNSYADVGVAIANLPDAQLRSLFLEMHASAAGGMDHFYSEVAHWFDESMARVSGVYKKWSQAWCFLIALVFAVIFNIDSVQLFKTLWLHPTLVAELASDKITTQDAIALFNQLHHLPIGWNNAFNWQVFLQPSVYLGWLITASASLFGAPFWFDTLKTLVRLRGAGTKPQSHAH